MCVCWRGVDRETSFHFFHFLWPFPFCGVWFFVRGWGFLGEDGRADESFFFFARTGLGVEAGR